MTASNTRDNDYMRAALGLARRGLGNTAPNPSVGCILVNNDHVVGRGWTQPGGRPHGEAVALQQAGDAARGATAYVTLEPCAHYGETPPCAESLVKAGVTRVVSAISDPDARVAGKGHQILRDAGIEVTEGVMRDAAWRSNLGFFKRIGEDRPQFTLKLATSQDNRIPQRGAQGEAKWITSPEARARGHLLRAQHDAVLFGIGTVLDDDPEYTCRLQGMERDSPVRILLDSELKLPAHSKLLQTLEEAPLWVICNDSADPARKLALEDQGVVVISTPKNEEGRPSPTWIAGELAARGLNRVLIESGPAVVSAFLNVGLVDEIHWFRAQKQLGDEGVAAFHGFSLEKLALPPTAVLQAGPDQLEIYYL